MKAGFTAAKVDVDEAAAAGHGAGGCLPNPSPVFEERWSAKLLEPVLWIRLLIVPLLLVLALPAAANRLRIEETRITLDQSVEITLILDGSFAEVDDIDLPLQNFQLEGSPSVSTEYRWINGVSSRRKVLRYRAHAQREGQATAGPLTLRDENGAEVTIAAVTVDVAADPLANARDAASMALALEQEGREAIFLVAEADKETAYVGEQVIVTWLLYTAEPVRDFSLVAKPAMEGFWVEEIPVTEEPVSSRIVAARRFQVVPVRRVAIFPVRAGELYVSPFEAVAQIIRPIRNPRGGISFFEGQVENVRRRSPSLRLDVRPLPGGAKPHAVGTWAVSCAAPVVSEAGPVAIDVTVSGTGNLRAARTPSFVRAPRGEVHVEDRGTKVARAERGVSMTRTWRLVVLPAATGALELPPVTFSSFDPQSAQMREQECGGARVTVRSLPRTAKGTPVPAETPRHSPSPDRRRAVAIAAAACSVVLAAILVFRRRSRSSHHAAAALARLDPLELREQLAALLREHGTTVEALRAAPTAAGDSWRAVESWLTIREREPLTANAATGELQLRLADLIRDLRASGRGRG